MGAQQGKRRGTLYPVRFNIGLDSTMANRIKAASDRYKIAEAVILRGAIARGLDKSIDAIRKASEPKTERGTEG